MPAVPAPEAVPLPADSLAVSPDNPEVSLGANGVIAPKLDLAAAQAHMFRASRENSISVNADAAFDAMKTAGAEAAAAAGADAEVEKSLAC